MLTLFVTLLVLPLAVGLLLDWLRGGRDQRVAIASASPSSVPPASRPSRPSVATSDHEPGSSRTLNEKCA